MQSGYIMPSYLQPITGLIAAARSYVLPLVDHLTKKPDLASIALVLLILFLSLKVLNMLWQAVMFWVRLATRIIFWGGAIVVALWVVNRGMDGVVEDVGHWTQIWSSEYQHWSDQSQSARTMKNKFGAGSRRGR